MIRWAPRPRTSVLQRGVAEAGEEQRRGLAKMEAAWKDPATRRNAQSHRKRKEAGRNDFPEPLGDPGPASTFVSAFRPPPPLPGWERMGCCGFKPPGMWPLIAAALETSTLPAEPGRKAWTDFPAGEADAGIWEERLGVFGEQAESPDRLCGPCCARLQNSSPDAPHRWAASAHFPAWSLSGLRSSSLLGGLVLYSPVSPESKAASGSA